MGKIPVLQCAAMDQLLLFGLRVLVGAGAFALIGRLIFTSSAYLAWRAYAFYALAGLAGLGLLVYRVAIGLDHVPSTSEFTILIIFEPVFTLGLIASLWEHVMADRRRHADSQKLMEQRRQSSMLAQKRAEELEVLFHITRDLTASLDLQKVLRTVMDRALSISGADGVAVFERNDETGELTSYRVAAAVSERLGSLPPPRPEGLTLTVAQCGEAAFISDIHKNTLYRGEADRTLRAIASVPLILEGRVVGVMNVLYARPHDFDDEEMHLLKALADTAALAVHHAAMHERITRLAVTDELTGLANRRRFMELLRQEVQRARRYGRPLTLLMIDLDRLKQINDEYGHAAGDAMLRGVAECMRNNLRATDRPARLGGDEFAALLPETARAEGLVIAERIRANVEKFRTQVNSTVIHSTVSIGVASRAAGEVGDLPSFIHLADDALYQAKTGGRNAVTAIEAPARNENKSKP
jgi:diguanylate cyclase (GGDEF)-like protein